MTTIQVARNYISNDSGSTGSVAIVEGCAVNLTLLGGHSFIVACVGWDADTTSHGKQ